MLCVVHISAMLHGPVSATLRLFFIIPFLMIHGRGVDLELEMAVYLRNWQKVPTITESYPDLKVFRTKDKYTFDLLPIKY